MLAKNLETVQQVQRLFDLLYIKHVNLFIMIKCTNTDLF